MNSVDSKCEGSLKPLDRAHTRSKVSHAEPIEEKEIAAMQNFIENALQTRLQVHLWANRLCCNMIDWICTGEPNTIQLSTPTPGRNDTIRADRWSLCNWFPAEQRRCLAGSLSKNTTGTDAMYIATYSRGRSLTTALWYTFQILLLCVTRGRGIVSILGDDRHYFCIHFISTQFGIISVCLCDTDTSHACKKSRETQKPWICRFRWTCF